MPKANLNTIKGKTMRGIYLLTQSYYTGYDTYDSMIIIAESKKEAIQISIDEEGGFYKAWPSKSTMIDCELIGAPLATQSNGIVLASFNAG